MNFLDVTFKVTSYDRHVWGRWVAGADQGLASVQEVFIAKGLKMLDESVCKPRFSHALALFYPEPFYKSFQDAA